MHPAIRGWREVREQLRLNKIYQGLRVSDDRPRYVFHGDLSLVDFRKKFRDRKTIAMFPPLSGNQRNGIKIPGLRTLYRPIMGASPATYYVKNGGSDAADGLSDGNAWATLSKALTGPYSAADIVQFKRDSTWTESGRWIPPSSGSSGNPITFKDYGSGAIPEFKFTGADWDYMHLYSKSWIDFENLNIDANAQATCGYACAVGGGTNNLNFTGCKFHNTGGNGAVFFLTSQTGDVSNIVVDDCDIYDAGGTSQGEAFYGNSYHATYTMSYVTLKNSRLYNCFEGIHWRKQSAGNTDLSYGTFENNELYNLHSASPDVVIECNADTTYTEFLYNYIHDCGQDAAFTMIFQTSPGAGSATNKYAYNIIDTCVVTDSSDGSAFRFYDVPGGWKIYNNAVYALTSSGDEMNGIVLVGTTDYVEAKNNAFHTLNQHVRNKGGTSNNDFDYNCRYAGTQGDLTGGNDITADPLWRDAANGNFHLQSGSTLIDAGVSVGFEGENDYYGRLIRPGDPIDIGVSQTLKGGPRRL